MFSYLDCMILLFDLSFFLFEGYFAMKAFISIFSFNIYFC